MNEKTFHHEYLQLEQSVNRMLQELTEIRGQLFAFGTQLKTSGGKKQAELSLSNGLKQQYQALAKKIEQVNLHISGMRILNEDTVFGMDFYKFCEVMTKEGFEVDYTETFRSSFGQDEEQIVLWKDGMLINTTSFCGQLDQATLFTELELYTPVRNLGDLMYLRTNRGFGFNTGAPVNGQVTEMAYHTMETDGMRARVHHLEELGKVRAKWTLPNFVYILNASDLLQTDLSVDLLAKQKLRKLSKHVQNAMPMAL